MKLVLTIMKNNFIDMNGAINYLIRMFEMFIVYTNKLRPSITGLLDLSLRIWIALIFWKSGVLKLSNWDTTLFLFEDEYQVPFLPFEIAAYLGTFNEIVMPILLVLGLATRFAVIPLLVTTAIIQYTYAHNHDHFIWALVLLVIFIRGAGIYSWDYFIHNKIIADTKCSDIVNKCSCTRLIACIVVVSLTIITSHEVLSLVIESFTPWLDGILKCWNKIGK